MTTIPGTYYFKRAEDGHGVQLRVEVLVGQVEVGGTGPVIPDAVAMGLALLPAPAFALAFAPILWEAHEVMQRTIDDVLAAARAAEPRSVP